MTVATYEAPNAGRSWLTLQTPAVELANAIAGTEFVPVHFRNNPAAIAAAILYGDEVGLGPMRSLAMISVINGKPTLASEAQRALILHAGHDLWVEESTASRCTVVGRRRGSEATSRITWTMDDAKRANLAGKTPWKLYPRQMLLARASSDLARAVFPDAIGGLAATEEIDDALAIQERPAPPQEPTTRRRRANLTQGPEATTTPDTPGLPPEIATPSPPPEPEPSPLPPEPDYDPTPPPPVPPPEMEEPPPAPPPLPGELPPDRPDPEEAMITDAQRRKMQAMFRERGITERQERLDYCTAQTGRVITSANDLTMTEASQLIDGLGAADPAETLGVPAGEPSDYATPDQREELFNARMAAGISDFRLREILQEITGQQVTANIPAAQFLAVMDAVQAEGDQFQ